MSQQPSPGTPIDATTSGTRGRASRAAGAAAIALQLLVVSATLVINASGGIGTGIYPVLAIGQAMLGAVVVIALASRRDRRAIRVPLVSAVLTALLMWIGPTAVATACSEEERAIVTELTHPAGVVVDLRGATPSDVSENRCWMPITTDLDTDGLIAHYRAEFDESGWQVHSGQRDSTGWATMTWLGADHYVGITASVDDERFVTLEISEAAGQEGGDVTPLTCSETETDAITRLTPPAGATAWPPWGQPAAFPGSDVAGCLTEFSYYPTGSGSTMAQVLDHYGGQLATDGWQVLERTLESTDPPSDVAIVAIGEITGSDRETRTTVRVVGHTGTEALDDELPVSVTVIATDESP